MHRRMLVPLDEPTRRRGYCLSRKRRRGACRL